MSIYDKLRYNLVSFIFQSHLSGILVLYMTMDHQTSHKGIFLFEFTEEISFHLCMVCYDWTIFG